MRSLRLDDLTLLKLKLVALLSLLAPSSLLSRLLAGPCLLRWRLLRSVFSAALSHVAPLGAQGFQVLFTASSSSSTSVVVVVVVVAVV